MEKEFDYTFKKSYPYIETSVLKHKEAGNIIGIIRGGRLKHFIEFESYGLCEYDEDDTKLINVHVTKMSKFNRLRTNVMIFNVYNNDWNPGVYDKLFVFKTNWTKDPVLNFVFHNTKTGKSMHHPEIEFAYDILAQDIMKVFNTLHKKEIFDFYGAKILKNKGDKFNDKCLEIHYDPIIERYKSAQWTDIDKNTGQAV